MKKAIPGCILLAAALLLLTVSLYHGSFIKQAEKTMSIRTPKKMFSIELLESFYTAASDKAKENTGKQGEKEERENQAPDITAWEGKDGAKVSNPHMGEAKNVQLYTVWGDMAQAFPAEFLSGAFIYTGDDTGCVISDALAEVLFRSHSVKGQKVICEEKEYIIRGVVQNSDPILLIQAQKGEVFPYLELEYKNGGMSLYSTENLLYQLGAGEESIIMNGNFWSFAAETVRMLPLWILGLQIFTISLRRARKESVNWLKYLKYTCILLFFGILFGYGAANFIQIPQDYIPAEWSDFQFWTEKFKSVAENYRRLLPYQTLYKDSILWLHLKLCILSSAGSSIFIMLWYWIYAKPGLLPSVPKDKKQDKPEQ